MKLTPIEQVKAGDAFRSENGRIFIAADETRKHDGCMFDPGDCTVECGGVYGIIITAELPTVRVLAETATYFRDYLAAVVTGYEVNGKRAKPEIYDMLAELEGLVGKAEVKV